MIVRFARPYAKAFLDTVGDAAAATAAIAELRRFVEAMGSVPRIATMAQSPNVPQAVKKKAVAALAERLAIGRASRSLLDLLVENYRLASLAAIVEAIEELHDRRLGKVKATVTSAEEMSPDEGEQLRGVFATALGKIVDLETKVSPELIGGFVAQVGSRRYDGSLRGQLERMSQQLAEAGAL